MRLPFGTSQTIRFHAAPLRRALLCLCALILTLQLAATAFHQHDLHEHLPECVSCQMASNLPADLPAAGPLLIAVFVAVGWLLARLPSTVDVQVRRYLIPLRQAPPAPPFSVR